MHTRSLHDLMNNLPQTGCVRWIGVRPARGEAVVETHAVEARLGSGLVGDRYAGRGGKREVTLVQWEHLPVIAAVLGQDHLDVGLLRRNIAVSGINLLALRNQYFQIGAAVLQGVDPCHPCSKMETLLGPGGYNAMRGHGGITARVIRPGIIAVDDSVRLLQQAP